MKALLTLVLILLFIPMLLLKSLADPAGGAAAPAGGAAAPAGGAAAPAGGASNSGSTSLALSEPDLSVPESPAFTVLDISPETVTRPGTPRAFAASLLNSVDDKGNPKTGTAIDINPYLLINGPKLTLAEYRKPSNYFLRFLARSVVSFATAKGSSDSDKSIRVALGFQSVPLDAGDPRLDSHLIDVLQQKISLDVGADDATAVSNALKDSADRNWNKTQFVFGGAPSWVGLDGTTKHLIWNGSGFWASYGYGFDRTNQFIVHYRYRKSEQVADPNNQGSFIRQDSSYVGFRYRAGNPNTAYSIEIAGITEKPIGGNHSFTRRITLNFEQKVADNLWLAATAGKNNGGQDNGVSIFGLDLKFGFSPKSQLTN